MRDSTVLLTSDRMKKNISLAYRPGSPVHCGLVRLADKWTLMIIGHLLSGPMHFGELKHSVEGISKKVLTQYLRSLERDGMVRRRESNNSRTQRRTIYSLTAFGRSTQKPIEAVRHWAERSFARLHENRVEYDALATGNAGKNRKDGQ